MSSQQLQPSNEDLARWLQIPDKIGFSLSAIHEIIQSIEKTGCIQGKSEDETNSFLTKTFPIYIDSIMNLSNINEQNGDKIVQFLGYVSYFCVRKSVDNCIQLANCVYRIFNKNEKLWKSKPELLFCLYSYSIDPENLPSHESASLFPNYRFNYEYLKQYFINNENVNLSQCLAMLSLCTTNTFPNNTKYALKFLDFISKLDKKSLLKYENKYLRNAIFVLLDNQATSFKEIFPSHVLSPFTDICIMSEVIERQILGTTIIKKLIQIDPTDYYFKEWAASQGAVLIKYLKLQSNSDLIKALADLSRYYIENMKVTDRELKEIVKIMREAHTSVKNDYFPILEHVISNFYQNNQRVSIDDILDQVDDVYICILGISSAHSPDNFEKVKSLLNASLEWHQINGFITFASYSVNTCGMVISACFDALHGVKDVAKGSPIIKLLERVCSNANSYILQKNIYRLIELIKYNERTNSMPLFKLVKTVILRLGRPLENNEIINLIQYITKGYTPQGLSMLKDIVAERGLDFIEYGALKSFLDVVLNEDTPLEYIKFYGDFTLQYMRKYDVDHRIIDCFLKYALMCEHSPEATESTFQTIYFLLLFSSNDIRYSFMNNLINNLINSQTCDIRRLKLITYILDRYFKYENSRYYQSNHYRFNYSMNQFKPIKNKGTIHVNIIIESGGTQRMTLSETDRIIEIEECITVTQKYKPTKFCLFFEGTRVDELATVAEAGFFEEIQIFARPYPSHFLYTLDDWLTLPNMIESIYQQFSIQSGIESDQVVWNFIKRFDTKKIISKIERPFVKIRYQSEDLLRSNNIQSKQDEAFRFIDETKTNRDVLNPFTGPKFLRLMQKMSYGIDSDFVKLLVHTTVNSYKKITKKLFNEIINSIKFALKSKSRDIEDALSSKDFIILAMNNENDLIRSIFEKFSDEGKNKIFQIATDHIRSQRLQLNCPMISFLSSTLSNSCDITNIFSQILSLLDQNDQSIVIEAGNFFLKASELKLIEKLKSDEQKSLVDTILHLALTKNIAPLQKSAFEIIKTLLLDGNINKENVIEIISKSIKEIDSTKFRGAQSPTRTKQYCGLRNLGSTCYMNSVIQQLFFIRIFRHEIYKTSQRECHDEPIIGELKSLFTQMAFADKQYCDTQNLFAKMQSTFLGKVSPRDQMDSFEFFDALMMKLPKEISDFFKGVASNKITIGSETKVTDEDIYHLTLPVKNFTSLEDSLESDSNPTIHQGIKGSDDKQESAMQSTTIEKLPDCMVIQLARFKYTTGSTGVVIEKNNDRFEFPMELDMNNFKITSQTKRKYKLCGIVTHSGTPVTGHYCAVVNRNDKWFLFDDHNVTEVDNNFIESTYGNGKSNTVCAYMLFYIDENKLRDDTDPISEGHLEIIGQEVKDIKESNSIFLRSMSLFTEEFADFILSLDNDELTLQYFFKVFICKSLPSKAQTICNAVIASIPKLKNVAPKFFSDNMELLIYSLGKSAPDSLPFIINVITCLTENISDDIASKFIDQVLSQLVENYKTYSMIPNHGTVIYNFTKIHPKAAEEIEVFSRVLDIIQKFYQEVTSDIAVKSVDMSSLLQILQIGLSEGKMKASEFPYKFIDALNKSKNNEKAIQDIIQYLDINYIDAKYLSSEVNITNMLELCQSEEEIEAAIIKLKNKDKLKTLTNTKFLVKHYKASLFPILVCEEPTLREWAEEICRSMFSTATADPNFITAEMINKDQPIVSLVEYSSDASNPYKDFRSDLQKFITKRCNDIHTDGQLCNAFRILDRASLLDKRAKMKILWQIFSVHIKEKMNVIELLRSFMHVPRNKLTASFEENADEYLKIFPKINSQYIPSLLYMFLNVFVDTLKIPKCFQILTNSENSYRFIKAIQTTIDGKIFKPVSIFTNIVTSIDIETSYELIKEIPQFIKVWSRETNKYYTDAKDLIDDLQFISLLNIVIFNLDSIIQNNLLISTVTLMTDLQKIFEFELFDEQIRIIAVTIAKSNNPSNIENLEKLLLMGNEYKDIAQILDNIPIVTSIPGTWKLRAISARIDPREGHKTAIAGELMEYITVVSLETSYVTLDALIKEIEEPPIWAYMIHELVLNDPRYENYKKNENVAKCLEELSELCGKE